MNPTLYAVRDDGAELWDTGEPSPFPGEPGLGYIVTPDGKQYDPRPILSLTGQGSWTLADETGEKWDADPEMESKREYTRDRLGRFSEVPGSGLADFMLNAKATSKTPVNLAMVRVGGTAQPDVFRINHGVPRDQMPQVPNAHKPAFLAAMKEQGVKVEKVMVDPTTLHPVQGEIDARRAAEMLPYAPNLVEDNPITISSDGYVLDGHHRWAAAVAEEHRSGGVKIAANRVDLPIDELLKRTAAWNEDASITARAFGSKVDLMTAEEKAEAIDAYWADVEPEVKKSFHAIQRHGGWLWAGRPGGGGPGHRRSTVEQIQRQSTLAKGKPDIIEVEDPFGDKIRLSKADSMWHHLEQKPDGSWGFTAERERLHRKIVQDTLRGVPRSKNPTLFMLGGGPAAGKSTMLEKGHTDVPTTGENGSARNAVLVNADEVKAALPEYSNGANGGATFVHEESSWVAKQIQAAALHAKRDIVLDGTGDSKVQKLTAKIQQAREAGYRVEGHYATVPTEVAVERARLRGEQTGRVVPESVIRGTHADVSRTFPQAHHLFDVVNLYDTMNGARLIASGHRGEPLNVIDAKAYADFIAKGKG